MLSGDWLIPSNAAMRISKTREKRRFTAWKPSVDWSADPATGQDRLFLNLPRSTTAPGTTPTRAWGHVSSSRSLAGRRCRAWVTAAAVSQRARPKPDGREAAQRRGGPSRPSGGPGLAALCRVPHGGGGRRRQCRGRHCQSCQRRTRQWRVARPRRGGRPPGALTAHWGDGPRARGGGGCRLEARPNGGRGLCSGTAGRRRGGRDPVVVAALVPTRATG